MSNMSSYADIAAQNAPPPSQQPKPDPNLLEGGSTYSNETTSLPDVDSGKVTVVPADQDLDNIKTETSEKIRESQEAAEKQTAKLQREAKEAEKRAKAAARKAEKKIEGVYNDSSKKAKKAWSRFSSDPSIWVPTLGASEFYELS
jgi:hypothetical protein